MKMKGKKKDIYYYGFRLSYRLEKRKSGETLIMSFCDAGSGKIIYEGAPRVITKAKRKGLPIEKIVEEFVPNFLRELFSPEEKLPPERLRKTYRDLPLAVIWELDKSKMQKDNNWSASTAAEYENNFRWIKKQWGGLPIFQVTPARCAPKLEQLPLDKHVRMVRSIRQLFYCEAELGLLNDNPWEYYSVQSRNQPENWERLAQLNIANYRLTPEQCRRIAARCMSGLISRTEGGHYFAVLLLMSLAVEINELIALTFGDCQYLKHYPDRLCINITRHIKRVGKKWTIQNITQPAKIRRLAAPSIVKDAFEVYQTAAKPKANMEYVLPSQRNPKRRTTPEEFKRWVATHFKDIMDECTMTGPVNSTKDCCDVLHATALAQLDICGFENEEIRYAQGLVLQTTHGKHYCDFGNEAELNRMGALLDRATSPWKSRDQRKQLPERQPISRRGGTCEWAAAPNNRGNIRVQIAIPAAQQNVTLKKDLELEIGIPYGGQMNVSFEEGIK